MFSIEIETGKFNSKDRVRKFFNATKTRKAARDSIVVYLTGLLPSLDPHPPKNCEFPIVVLDEWPADLVFLLLEEYWQPYIVKDDNGNWEFCWWKDGGHGDPIWFFIEEKK